MIKHIHIFVIFKKLVKITLTYSLKLFFISLHFLKFFFREQPNNVKKF